MLLTLLAKKGTAVASKTYATWNSADKGATITLSGANLIASNSAASHAAVRANQGKSAGKWTIELATSIGSAASILGFGNATFSLATFLGGSANSAALQVGGSGFSAGSITTAFSIADTHIVPYMWAFDLTAGKAWVAVNGVWFNSGDPVAGTNPIYTWAGGTLTLFPACSLTNVGAPLITLNAGASAFTNTVPSGFNSGWYI
jgi:hypothetical protein